MKIRIISDGTSFGTKVLTEDGKQLEYIQHIDVTIPVDGFVDARIFFTKVPIDIVAETHET